MEICHILPSDSRWRCHSMALGDRRPTVGERWKGGGEPVDERVGCERAAFGR
ncbi:hypothetical protein HMPREF9135_0734 [Segatella baroniae F0067]|uniref:Uncharacterized protein n=1 Tax=Segatella baroniae F0067 TaxID=1115809 RepID=U2NLE5_9BACT|nr:hypothetical protein HMPREF9135_0734 [Segatella baroniae F0067]